MHRVVLRVSHENVAEIIHANSVWVEQATSLNPVCAVRVHEATFLVVDLQNVTSSFCSIVEGKGQPARF